MSLTVLISHDETNNYFRPGLVPGFFVSAWEQRKLGELCEINSGRDYKHLGVGPIPVYGTGGYMLSVDEALSHDRDAVGVGRKGTIDKPYKLRAPFWTVDTLFYCIPEQSVDLGFLEGLFLNVGWASKDESTGLPSLSKTIIGDVDVLVPEKDEQVAISGVLASLDNLITLHQREQKMRRELKLMLQQIKPDTRFIEYYSQWVKVYKEGAIREVTMDKYRLSLSWLERLVPNLLLSELNRVSYQTIINRYAERHERQTTMDFHHQLKGAILDAVDEGFIPRDPTRKVIIKGRTPRVKKTKYLNQFELHAVLADLNLSAEPSWDWLILLIAKTGLRFSEALGLTPDDFDFVHQTVSVNKTWDYKRDGGFVPTKNVSSMRKVQLDWQLVMQLSGLLKGLPASEPIFVHGKVYNSTANAALTRHCKNVQVPVISIHGLRHTHASLLLFAGVSIASVSRRLGHASMTTTQETYLHIIQELENQDVDIVMRSLSSLV